MWQAMDEKEKGPYEKKAEAAKKKGILGQMSLNELPEKPIEADLSHELDQDLIGTSPPHSTIENKTEKQNHSRTFEEKAMFLKTDLKELKGSPSLGDQQAARATLVPDQELEEAVQNICDL